MKFKTSMKYYYSYVDETYEIAEIMSNMGYTTKLDNGMTVVSPNGESISTLSEFRDHVTKVYGDIDLIDDDLQNIIMRLDKHPKDSTTSYVNDVYEAPIVTEAIEFLEQDAFGNIEFLNGFEWLNLYHYYNNLYLNNLAPELFTKILDIFANKLVNLIREENTPRMTGDGVHEGIEDQLQEIEQETDVDRRMLLIDHIKDVAHHGGTVAEYFSDDEEELREIFDLMKNPNMDKDRIIKIKEATWALIDSIRDNDLQGVKEAIENGANIHADDDFALRWAASKGYLPIVKYLVEHGADIHAEDDYALRWAVGWGHLPVVEYLVEQGADIHTNDGQLLRYAAWDGYLPIVEYLVEHDADIHAKGDIALRDAAWKGHLPVVKYLVENGANIHAEDDQALRYATLRGHLTIVEYLKEQYRKQNIPLPEDIHTGSKLTKTYYVYSI